MKITCKSINQNIVLTISADNDSKEDEIIKNWHEQILDHLSKLKLKWQ